MGYSHYFTAVRDITDKEWADLCRYTRLLLEKLPEHSESAGGPFRNEPLMLVERQDMPWLPPRIDEERICFIGDGYTAQGWRLWSETFLLERNPQPDEYDDPAEYPYGFSSCKTRMFPYDLAVCGVLILCHKLASGWREIGTDFDAGDPDEAWEPARSWVSLVFETEFKLPWQN